MNTFQILMLAATLFFAYQIFRHVQELEDSAESQPAERERTLSAAELVDLADKAYEEGALEQALGHLEAAAALDADNPEVLNKYAFVTARLGDLPRAITLYRRSLQLDANDDLTHNALASLYRQNGDYESARSHYEKAIAIDDTYAQTYYNYANLLADMKNRTEAEAMYLRALELDPGMNEARDALRELKGDA